MSNQLFQRVAIVGTRHFEDYDLLCSVLDELISKNIISQNCTIISGGAKGADSMAERFAKERSMETKIHHPAYKKFGRKAPIIRNKWIVKDAEMVVAFWNGQSSGTGFTVQYAREKEKPLLVIDYDQLR